MCEFLSAYQACERLKTCQCGPFSHPITAWINPPPHDLKGKSSNNWCLDEKHDGDADEVEDTDEEKGDRCN